MMGAGIHVPRPARLAATARAHLSTTAMPTAVVAQVLADHRLEAIGPPRPLPLGRRSDNVVVPTAWRPVVVKRYRHDWTAERVAHVHSVLEELAARGSPGPRPVHRPDGGVGTRVGERHFVVLEVLPGRNVSLDYLGRTGHVRAAAVAGRALARLHADLDGFEPAGAHHLGFVGGGGPPRLPGAWYAAAVDRLRSLDPTGLPDAATLVARAGELGERLARLDEVVGGADLRRIVVHGDYGLHNLVFARHDVAVPVDFELARLDWRLTDLVLALGRFGPSRTTWHVPAVEAFLAAYTRRQPVEPDELAHLGDVWRLVRLQAAVRAADAAGRGEDAQRRWRAAREAVDEVDWLDADPRGLRRVVRLARVQPVALSWAAGPGDDHA